MPENEEKQEFLTSEDMVKIAEEKPGALFQMADIEKVAIPAGLKKGLTKGIAALSGMGGKAATVAKKGKEVAKKGVEVAKGKAAAAKEVVKKHPKKAAGGLAGLLLGAGAAGGYAAKD